MKPIARPISADEAREHRREFVDSKAKLQAEHDEIGEWIRKVAIYFSSSEERLRLTLEQQDLKEKIAAIDVRIAEFNVFLKGC
jgi:hypothetical protein